MLTEGLKLFTSITGLALADAVNVCAFAVLAMVLIAILTKNPDKPKIILKAGILFSLAIFLMYFLYGVVILQLFRTFAESIQTIAPYIQDTLSILIMIIGALNIKDYFFYSPGGITTEMPLWMRPRAKLIINRVTSPMGAFVVGLFVTLFLLPCTVAPLIRAMGNLSDLGYTAITSLPWLIYYNFVFILPMLIITLLIYFGFSQVDDVVGWKERNVRRLHLVAGILLFLVGVSLLAGWL